MNLAISILFFTLGIHAQTKEKSAFEQALEQDQLVTTKERWIERNGVRYREVIYETRKFYLQFRQQDDGVLKLTCDNLNSNPSQSTLGEVGVNVYRRTRLFVQFLQVNCSSPVNGRSKPELVLDPRIGFTLPEDEKSLVKNKKVFFSPLNGVGFSGEW